MPRIKSKVIRVKDPDGIWHDLPAVVSEEAMAAAERANQAEQAARSCITSAQAAADDAEVAASEAEASAAQARAWTPDAVNEWLDAHPDQKIQVDELGFVTPEMFGGRGDGVTDDTDAIQAAIDNAGEFTVYIPAGVTYAIAGVNPIIVKSGTKIRFDGTIKATAAADTCFQFYDGETETPVYTGVHDVCIYGSGTFDANGNRLSSAYMTPFRIHHCKDINISGITIKNYSKYHAIEIGGSSDVLIDSVKFKGMFDNEANTTTGEAIQIEKITEAGTGGAIPYDGTMCKNITIRNCYFGESGEGGKMYTAVGTHEQVSDADATMQNMHDNITIEGCLIENTSWKPGNSGSPLNNPYYAALGFTYNLKNLMIRDNVFMNVGVGIGVVLYRYCDSISIERNKFINVYGSGIAAYQDCSNLSIIGNEINGFGAYCEEHESQNLAVGIYIGSGCHNDLKVKQNFIKTETGYAVLPIHLPGVQFNDFGKMEFSGNLLDVLTVLPSAQVDTFQNNFRRYNRDNSIIIYDNSSGIYLGDILSNYDLRLFNKIEIVYTIPNVGSNSVIVTQDQILNAHDLPIKEFNLANSGATTDYALYEMNINTDANYTKFTIASNLRLRDTSEKTIVKYANSSSGTDFIKVLKIRGFFGQNMIV